MKRSKTALVCGAGGFIGTHLVNYLVDMGYYVVGIDLKYPEYSTSVANEFIIGDLRDMSICEKLFATHYDEVYQLAADMGGAGYIFVGENDADIVHNSATINLNISHLCAKFGAGKVFFSSSACVYPQYNQLDESNPKCSEESAYPADPDSDYGIEKLFSERVYLAYNRNYGLSVAIARFHNIFGPLGTWKDGKEKAPAAICRKVAQSEDGGSIEIWGDGKQTRSFLYIDECLVGIRKLMDSDFTGPVNIGSDEMVSINDLANMVIGVSGKDLSIVNIPGPLGVRGRNSDNALICAKLGWQPTTKLCDGIEKLYDWIEDRVRDV